MANKYITHFGSSGSWGEPNPTPPSAQSKKFHPGYYFAINYGDVQTLSANITSTATTMNLSGGTGIYPASGVIWIDNERITYTGKGATTITGCVRGTQGTAAVAHSAGDYVKLHKTRKSEMSNYPTTRTEISSRLALRGILVRSSWRDIETSENVYDFTEWDEVLADMTAAGKRMCVMIEVRSGDLSSTPVPDYVINNASSEKGQFQYTGRANGYYVKLWNAYTKARFKLFLEAVANHFDAQPNFEMFQMSECSLGTAINPQPSGYPPVPTNYRNLWYAGLWECTKHLNSFTPNTITTQLLNFDRDQISPIIQSLVDAGIGLGCPNTLKDDPGSHVTGTNKGIFEWFKIYKNIVPICPSYQRPEHYYSNLTWSLKNYKTGIADDGTPPSGGTVPNPTYAWIRDWVNTPAYQPNYIFVTRLEFAVGTSNVTGNFYKDDFLEFLNQAPQNASVSGGLNTTPPSKYASTFGD